MTPGTRKAVSLALAAVPLAHLAVVAWLFAVDLPLWDHWYLVPAIGRAFDGTISFGDLWAQHNEHRMLFPKLLTFALARLTGFDVRAEVAAHVGLAAIVLAVAAREGLRARHAWAVATLPILSLATFTFRKYTTWFESWQLPFLVNVAAVVSGAALLARPDLGRAGFAAALGLGAVATFSQGTGFAFWPLALFLVVFARPERAVLPRLATIAAVALTVSAVYFLGYVAPLAQGSALAGIARPFVALEYVLLFVGGAVAPLSEEQLLDLRTVHPVVPVACATLGIAAFGVLADAHARRHRDERRFLGFVLALALYPLGAAALGALGRAPSAGVLQALAHRYVAVSSLFWIGLALLALRLSPEGPKRWLARGALSVVVALLVFGDLSTLSIPIRRRPYLAAWRQDLKQGGPIARDICPDDPAVVASGLETLRKHRISMFR